VGAVAPPWSFSSSPPPNESEVWTSMSSTTDAKEGRSQPLRARVCTDPSVVPARRALIGTDHGSQPRRTDVPCLEMSTDLAVSGGPSSE